MRYLNRLFTAIQFYSRLPVPWQPPFDPEEFAESLMYAPLVGLLLGGVLAGASWALSLCIPPLLVAVLCLVLYIFLSGGLHFDGLGDTFDGLSSGRSRERMLEIMRDSRIGSFALLALVSVLLVDTAALASLRQPTMARALLLMPVLGRMGILISAADSSYARPEQGMGRAMIDYCTWSIIWPWLIAVVALCVAVWPLPWQGAILACSAALVALVLSRLIARTLGGATGDTLGAVVELAQAVVLVLAVAIIA